MPKHPPVTHDILDSSTEILWAELLGLPSEHPLVRYLTSLGTYPHGCQSMASFLKNGLQMPATRDKKTHSARERARLIVELILRHQSHGPDLKITTPEDVADYASTMRFLKQEYLKVLILNTRNAVIHVETVSIGTVNTSLAHPREIIRPVIHYGGAGFILVHNHPAGNPEPSPEDHRVTRRMVEVARLVDIPFLDHVIIGRCGTYSFRRDSDLWEKP